VMTGANATGWLRVLTCKKRRVVNHGSVNGVEKSVPWRVSVSIVWSVRLDQHHAVNRYRLSSSKLPVIVGCSFSKPRSFPSSSLSFVIIGLIQLSIESYEDVSHPQPISQFMH